MVPQLAQPQWLWLLLALPPLVWWWTRRQRLALRYPLAESLASLAEGRANRSRRLALAARVLALALAILALAGLRWPDERTRLDTEGIGMMLLVDVSGSMAERDFSWDGEPLSRLEAVQRAFKLLLIGGVAPDGTPFEGRPTDLAGVLAFATRGEKLRSPTLSHSVLVREIEKLEPMKDPRRAWTNLTDAILTSLERIQSVGKQRKKVLILLTDGIQTVDPAPSGWKMRRAAQAAHSLGIPIYVIDAGSDTPSPDESRTPVALAEFKDRRKEAVALMHQITEISNGRYLAASNSAALVEACKKLDGMERQTIQSFQYRRYYEAYPWLLLASLALLVLVITLERTRWRSLP
jgi:Ca-activated chloride channel family protein